MNRREFVVTTSMGAFALTLPSLYGCESVPDYPDSLGEPVELSYIMDEQTILDLGGQFRKQKPQESSEGELVNSLLKGLNGSSQIEEEIDLKIKDEFENNETVFIEGWIIAMTEARQCALYSIINA